ncbi:hypothetical protein RW1_035_01000 [Rhodococcus wratislaviensis NBRC 100605]|uniref:Uncharacterized protein n=1 Tax=Rhodococcus wratislaviensis NBRC 100605 TaxID=1219028 RepID=X0R7N7_RHOWR|nr:hypothetical protein RW1_035_01000 [Rhodococcus wratislaviensis NBRC 100605]
MDRMFLWHVADYVPSMDVYAQLCGWTPVAPPVVEVPPRKGAAGAPGGAPADRRARPVVGVTSGSPMLTAAVTEDGTIRVGFLSGTDVRTAASRRKRVVIQGRFVWLTTFRRSLLPSRPQAATRNNRTRVIVCIWGKSMPVADLWAFEYRSLGCGSLQRPDVDSG